MSKVTLPNIMSSFWNIVSQTFVLTVNLCLPRTPCEEVDSPELNKSLAERLLEKQRKEVQDEQKYTYIRLTTVMTFL